MSKKVDGILVPSDEIQEICQRLGAEITRDYQGQEILLICILKGAVVFMADLMREIKVPCEIDFMAVQSYTGTKTSGVVRIIKDLDLDIAGRHVLIVEDIIDSGLTLSHLIGLLKTRNPASLKIVACFDKPERRRAKLDIDYIGKAIPDEFIVGYGLDYEGQYRNLPDVSILCGTGEED
ncbi:MAG: hypoxanthine phosphoribosyltransferase [Eubacteriales bacterium]|nr:hypoxanthine phosphoribosyltransferase [Eubacteriales bacterium]